MSSVAAFAARRFFGSAMLAVLGALLASYHAGAEKSPGGPVLLQKSAMWIDRPKKKAAAVDANASPDALSATRPDDSHTDTLALGKAIEDTKASAAEKLEEEQKSFENASAKQEQQLNETQEENRRLSSAIDSLRDGSQRLRSSSEGLLKECDKLVLDLSVLNKNVSLVTELMAEAKRESLKRMQSAPELDVLKEMQEEQRAQEHRKELQSILKEGLPSDLSLLQAADAVIEDLQESSEADDSESDTQEQLKALRDALKKLAQAQKESAQKVHEALEQKKAEGESKIDLAVEEQARLNATLARESDINTQMQAADAKLHDVRDRLLNKSMAVRSFARRLASTVQPSNVTSSSLVQETEVHHEAERTLLSKLQSLLGSTMQEVESVAHERVRETTKAVRSVEQVASSAAEAAGKVVKAAVGAVAKDQ